MPRPPGVETGPLLPGEHLDFQERSLHVANAGLPHPLHDRAAEGRAVPLEVSGLALGTFEASRRALASLRQSSATAW